MVILASDPCLLVSVAKFWVTIARGTHPFPSRTRKLSPSAPIVLHAQVCGRVGSCPVIHQKPEPKGSGFCVFSTASPRCPIYI